MLALYLTSCGCTGTLPRALDSLAMGQQKDIVRTFRSRTTECLIKPPCGNSHELIEDEDV
jgi:hypothetical protein